MCGTKPLEDALLMWQQAHIYIAVDAGEPRMSLTWDAGVALGPDFTVLGRAFRIHQLDISRRPLNCLQIHPFSNHLTQMPASQ